MLSRIGQRLLQDPERGGLDRRGELGVAEVLGEADVPAGLLGHLVEASAGRCRETAVVDGGRAQGEQHAASFGDGLREPLDADGQLPRGLLPGRRPEIGARVEVLLGADDDLGHPVMQVVREAPPLLVLSQDDLLHQTRHRLGVSCLATPGAEHGVGRRQDDQHLHGMDEERRPRGPGRLERPHLQQLIGRHGHEGRRQDDLMVPLDRYRDPRPLHEWLHTTLKRRKGGGAPLPR